MDLKQGKKLTADVNQQIDEYMAAHSDIEPDYLAMLNREAHLHTLNPRMLSGHFQGRILKMLVCMIQPQRVLEIGTFVGYSALCIAEGLPDGGHIDTIEIDDELEEFIREQLAKTPFEERITLHIGDALQVIPQLDTTFDLVFIDADKRLYRDYYELVLPRLKSGGFILADNTLWDGKVLIDKPESNDYQTIAIKAFNDFIATDNRIEKVILPLRDGLTLIMKK
ncbi:MAG TPA: O-methyltransferase [Paludibacteraceae bacterium]|jgi:caffeoyl-CoA O-methyltransferase|nr:O-methyltransferase [Paludibacteraceae bacterium]HQB68925.1 O-methyltransferase [Paludibacteraceae bacterium]HRS67234.1 O-methyltransferase [Paludibacteraceae bacterium]